LDLMVLLCTWGHTDADQGMAKEPQAAAVRGGAWRHWLFAI